LSGDAAATTDPELPVTCVSWSDAVAHADWLSTRTGRTYRLPSEAEWEYAARAGSAQNHTVGASASLTLPIAKARVALTRTPQRVGSELPNAFGLHDAGGNVAEFAADCWRDRPTALPGDGSPAMRRPCDRRAVRDADVHDPNARGRLTARSPIGMGARSPRIGYRLAREL
jgi:formylglycine-generating enzyme required for sulfatase activity